MEEFGTILCAFTIVSACVYLGIKFAVWCESSNPEIILREQLAKEIKQDIERGIPAKDIAKELGFKLSQEEFGAIINEED